MTTKGGKASRVFVLPQQRLQVLIDTKNLMPNLSIDMLTMKFCFFQVQNVSQSTIARADLGKSCNFKVVRDSVRCLVIPIGRHVEGEEEMQSYRFMINWTLVIPFPGQWLHF